MPSGSPRPCRSCRSARHPNAAGLRRYPAEQPASLISLDRARKAVALIVKTADGSAIFTRVLAASETYRAPAVAGLTFDVSDPTGVDVYRIPTFADASSPACWPRCPASGWWCAGVQLTAAAKGLTRDRLRRHRLWVSARR